MQPNVPKEEYIRELDNLIEFFKTFRDKCYQNYNTIQENKRFSETALISLFTIFIAIALALLSLDKTAGLIYLLLLILLIGAYLFMSSRKQNVINSSYLSKIISCDTVITYLYYVKISKTKVDLSPLVAKLKISSDNRASFVKDFELIWIKEVIEILDFIDNESLAKENIS